MTSQIQNCPICGKDVNFNIRYPDYICRACEALAASPDGRLLSFANEAWGGGCKAFHLDDHSEYKSNICLVRGVSVWADEARFGGIVLRPMKDGHRPKDAYP